MTDMSNWTEDEKREYIRILQKLTKRDEITLHDLKKLSDNGRDALIVMYEGIIRDAKPKSMFERSKGLFK